MRIDLTVPPAAAEPTLAELYHENSKLHPVTARQQAAEFAMSEFELFVTSRGFRQFRTASRVTLPGPRPSGESITDVMHGRRSARDLHRPVDLADLGTLLPQSLGPTSVVEAPEAGVVQALRSCPSAGGLYPIDTYLLAAGVAGLAAGIYHYNVLTAELEALPGTEPVAGLLREGFFWQEFVASAAVAVLLVAVFERSTAKYGERGYRLALLDAGHAAQNLLLTARQLRLPAVAVGGFDDDLLAGALGLDGVAEAVVHTVVLGGRDD